MPFGYSSKIFSHPAIEYIPLLPLESYEITQTYPTESAQLFVVQTNERVDTFPFLRQIPSFRIDPSTEMGLILANSCLETIKYRGNYVTIVTKPVPGTHQVVKILTRYFYKPELIFQVVDHEGKVRTQKQLIWPTRR
jgi:hypothetical protein